MPLKRNPIVFEVFLNLFKENPILCEGVLKAIVFEGCVKGNPVHFEGLFKGNPILPEGF